MSVVSDGILPPRWPESRTRRVCSRIGVWFVCAALPVGLGAIVALALDAPGGRSLFGATVFYVLGGMAFRPSTWERIHVEFLPQQTPMAGILLVAVGTYGVFSGLFAVVAAALG